MTSQPPSASAPLPVDRYAEATEAWYRALGDYLRLARAGASAAKLRAAANAVHAAALRRGRLAGGPEDSAS